MSEHDEQCAVVKWFKSQYPKYAGCIMAIPNGSHLAGTKQQRFAKVARAKKEGMKNGVSDLFIAVPCGEYHGMWLEMKDKGKTACSVSKEQKEHLALMTEFGYYSVWAAGFDAAKEQIDIYLKDSHKA